MSRPVQIFDAPGAEDEPLPTAEPSPWLDDRHVRIPLEYWSLLLAFAERIDPMFATRLSALSGTAFVSEQTPSAGDRAFLAGVLDALVDAPPLVAEPDEEYPEAYPNAEIARMGRAALAVFDESLRRREPFRAWDE